MKRNPLSRLFSVAKYRAKQKGLKFTITKEDLPLPTHCPILGIKLAFNPGKRKANTYSIDRIDNKKGYVPGNVGVISWKANRMKSNFTLKEVGLLHKYLKKKIKQ